MRTDMAATGGWSAYVILGCSWHSGPSILARPRTCLSQVP